VRCGRSGRTVAEVGGALDGRVGDDDTVDAFDGAECTGDVL
jgi:hypothetical protein